MDNPQSDVFKSDITWEFAHLTDTLENFDDDDDIAIIEPKNYTPQTISFLELPVEIRIMIYQCHFIQSIPFELWAETGAQNKDHHVRAQLCRQYRRLFGKRKVNLGFLRTCKLVNAEAAEIFYGGNEFRFSGLNGHMIAWAYVSKIGIRHSQWLKSVTISMPILSENRSIYARYWNPLPWRRASEVYYDAPFPLPAGFKRRKWVLYDDAWCHLALHLRTAASLQKLVFVLPEYCRFYEYAPWRQTWSALNDLVAANPGLKIEIVRMRSTDIQAQHTTIWGYETVMETQDVVIRKLKSWTQGQVRKAFFDRRGRWNLIE